MARVGALIALGLAAALAQAVRAAEPVPVTVEGAAEVEGNEREAAGERALEAALLEAVVQVARGFVKPDVANEDERLRELLRPTADSAILVYRLESGRALRPSARDRSRQEVYVRVAATVDATQVRERLREAGLLARQEQKPAALVVTHADGSAIHPGVLAGLERYLKERLQRAGFAVVEPATRPGLPQLEGVPVELGRELGADLVLDVRFRWRPQQAGRPHEAGGDVRGSGTGELGAQALRTRDGVELAAARFEAPAYHGDPAEAQARALDALRPQLADNLLLQLGRNWDALEPQSREVEVLLSNVGGLAQVEAVREALGTSLGGGAVEVVELAPRRAELRVRADLAPGALQERVAALPLEGFHLEPVVVHGDRIELRVVPMELPAATPQR